MAGVDFSSRYKRFVRYFWDPEPKNDDPSMSPIWCLGQEYSAEQKNIDALDSDTGSRLEQERESEAVIVPDDIPKDQRKSCDVNGGIMPEASTSEEERGWPEDFLDDFESRLWFTYRSHFPAIPKSVDPQASSSLTLAVRLRSQLVEQGGFTSDTGWGCMIRSGQCLVANTLSILRLGRNWRRGTKATEERQLLSWFADHPDAPFSLHRFVQHGASACGKHPGEWFGPSATARCIQALSQAHPESGLKVYVTGDGPDVYEDSLFKLATEDGYGFQPVLILVGIRLGIDRVTPVYWEALKQSLQLPQSIGIAGGRPSASHYFVGVQGSHFFYLDPHHTRLMLPYHTNTSRYTDNDVTSCHTRRLRRLHIDQMDPSMLIAFLIRDENDWKAWRQEISNVQGKVVLHVGDKEPIFEAEVSEREGAINEVEALDEDQDEDDGEIINLPTPM